MRLPAFERFYGVDFSGAKEAGRAGKTLQRTVLYGAGTVSMLLISMTCSLSLWIFLPWGFLGWSPTLVTSGSMQPLVAPGDVVMIRPVSRRCSTSHSTTVGPSAARHLLWSSSREGVTTVPGPDRAPTRSSPAGAGQAASARRPAGS